MILLLNGAFGIGKTTVARLLVKCMKGAVLYDPERIGFVLQRIRRVDDFQDLRLWRRLTIVGLRIARLFCRNVVVPMAFSNVDYLQEIRDGASRFDSRVLHFCLVAPLDVVYARLRERGAEEWAFRRAAECCAVHGEAAFATPIDAATRPPSAIAGEIARLARQE